MNFHNFRKNQPGHICSKTPAFSSIMLIFIRTRSFSVKNWHTKKLITAWKFSKLRFWIWIWIKRNFIRVKYVSKRNFFQFPKSYKNIFNIVPSETSSKSNIISLWQIMVSYPFFIVRGPFIRPKLPIFDKNLAETGLNDDDKMTSHVMTSSFIKSTKMMQFIPWIGWLEVYLDFYLWSCQKYRGRLINIHELGVRNSSKPEIKSINLVMIMMPSWPEINKHHRKWHHKLVIFG